MAGYWPDATADVEIVVTVHNRGSLRLDDAVNLTVTCRRGTEAIDDCNREASVSLPDGFGPVTETLTLRAPAGEFSFDIDHGGETVKTLSLDVPARIVGVDRQVWECFRDASRAGTGREYHQGIGCAAWSHERIRKWDHRWPLRVWMSGPDGFTAELKDVLTKLSPLVNHRIEWVDAQSAADIKGYVGLTVAEANAEGAYCTSIDILGCANIRSHEAAGRLLGGEIIVYNLWPDIGSDFGDFDDWYKNRFRVAMIHEAVHIFTNMIHRTELLSIMNPEAHHRAELTPMDEALLRLHGHELVKPGMSMSEIERRIVFDDELLDVPPADHPVSHTRRRIGGLR